MNADAKISFKLATGYASEVALDEHGAEKLKDVGRCIYKTADRIEVQVPWLSDKAMMDRVQNVVGEIKPKEVHDGSLENEVGEVRQDIISFRDHEGGN